MKKSLAIILAVVLVCALLVVGAVAGGAQSPTQQGTTGAATEEEAASDVVVTSALNAEGEVAEAIKEAQAELEENAADLSKICADLATVEGIGDFSVLDLISISWGEEADAVLKEKGSVDIELEAKLAKDAEFHVIFKDAGKWVSVDDKAELLDNGNILLKAAQQGIYAILAK